MLAWIFGDCREGQIPRCLQRCKFDTPLLAAGSLIEKDIVTYMPDRMKNEIIEKWISLCYDKPKLFVHKKIQTRRIPLISRKGLE